MAATKKPAKRTARKKGGRAAKRSTAKKSATRRKGSRRAARSGATRTKSKRTASLKRQARRGLQAARGGIDTVRQVGDRAWETLKSTTAQVVEGVKETLNRDDEEPRYR